MCPFNLCLILCSNVVVIDECYFGAMSPKSCVNCDHTVIMVKIHMILNNSIASHIKCETFSSTIELPSTYDVSQWEMRHELLLSIYPVVVSLPYLAFFHLAAMLTSDHFLKLKRQHCLGLSECIIVIQRYSRPMSCHRSQYSLTSHANYSSM